MRPTKRQAAKEKLKSLKARTVKGEHVKGGTKKVEASRFELSIDGHSMAVFSELNGISSR